jgi:transcriptional regulator of acetoin/glycerol metabolism
MSGPQPKRRPDIDKIAVERALRMQSGHLRNTAKQLRINNATLWDRLREFDLVEKAVQFRNS